LADAPSLFNLDAANIIGLEALVGETLLFSIWEIPGRLHLKTILKTHSRCSGPLALEINGNLITENILNIF
jgi:hypothetical protein